MSLLDDGEAVLRLPHGDAERWSEICERLQSTPKNDAQALDALLTHFSRGVQRCEFFALAASESEDVATFVELGAPRLLELALDAPRLFAEPRLPLLLRRQPEPGERLAVHAVELTREQCACLLAHSVLGT